MWSRKSAMLGSLAVAMYLLGLTLRNSQLVTIAVVRVATSSSRSISKTTVSSAVEIYDTVWSSMTIP